MLEQVLKRIDQLADVFNLPDYNWLPLLSLIVVLCSSFQGYVSWRQYRHLETATIPEDVKEVVDEDTFRRSAEYKRACLKFGLVSTVFDAVIELCWLNLTVYPLFLALSDRFLQWADIPFFKGEIARNVILVQILTVTRSVIDLPLGIHQTFVIEEKFGFNKQTFGLFVKDFVKGQLISIVVALLMVSGLVAVIDWAGKAFFIYVTAFYLACNVLMLVAAPTIIQPLFNKYTPLEEGELRTAVNGLAESLNFPLTRIYVEDGSTRSSHSNAYFIGLPWYKQIVLFDTLIDSCSVNQITAVLAHEMGHWRRNHIAKNLVSIGILVLSAFSLFAIFFENDSLYRSVGFSEDQPVMARLLIFLSVASPLATIVQFLMSAMTRKFEFESDDFAVDLGRGEDLAEALVKINNKNLGTVSADWLYSVYTFTHPILSERLANIKQRMSLAEKKKK